MNSAYPIVMLPGIVADHRMFEDQLKSFPNLIVQDWIEPVPGEKLSDYARRLAEVIEVTGPAIVGGASFGGIVAREVALHMDARACILIGSLRSTSELSTGWKRLRVCARWGPSRLAKFAWFAWRFGGRWLNRRQACYLRHLSRPEAAFERWAIWALLNHQTSSDADRIPVYQIHGANDRTLPVELTRPDVIVPHGEHALTISCPSAVNDFIANVLQSVSSDE